MSSLESTQARFFLEQIALRWFKNEHPLTKRVIEAVPLDKGDYRPDPISRTATPYTYGRTLYVQSTTSVAAGKSSRNR